MDNDTQWNSQFLMLNTAIKLWTHIKRTMMDNLEDLRDNYLTPADWAELEVIYKFLYLFEQVIRSCEGDNITLNQILYIVNFLINYLNYSKAAY